MYRSLTINKIFLAILLSFSTLVAAEQYQSSENFIDQTFDGSPPKPKLLWMSKAIMPTAKKILGHKPGFLRTRYWQLETKSVWILEEIGKTKPITVGIVINNNQIEQVKVLAFRESRGWEVKHSFFTDQFHLATLNTDMKLNQNIDGITGATLSVQALTRLARLALFFDQKIQP